MKPQHKKYILENINKKSIQEIAKDLGLKEKEIKEFLEREKATPKNNYEIPINIVVIVFICAAIIFFLLAGTVKIPLSTLILKMCNNFYPFGSENIFIVMTINNINAYIYIYALIGIFIFITLFFKKYWTRTQNKIKLPFQPHTIFLVALVVFFLTTGIQTINQIKRFSGEIKTFSGKTLPKKNSFIFGIPYKFAMFCRQHLPGEHRGKFISDFDISKDPGMTLHRRLSYHLYPINIRVVMDQPIDCYVVFHKRNPKATIPKDFKTLYAFDRFNVLAIKKRPE